MSKGRELSDYIDDLITAIVDVRPTMPSGFPQ